MFTLGQGTVKTCSGLTRRDFLRVGSVGLGSLGLPLTDANAGVCTFPRDGRAVILLMLVGGPSQLEKPGTQSRMPPRRSGDRSDPSPPGSPVCGSASTYLDLRTGWIALRSSDRCVMTPRRSTKPDSNCCKLAIFLELMTSTRTSVQWQPNGSEPGTTRPPS